MNKRIIIYAVHPDDETLGCGGTILRHLDEGDEVYWIIVTDMREEQGFSPSVIRKRNSEIEQIGECYPFKDIFRLGFPTTQMDTVPTNKLVNALLAPIDRIQPDVLYIPYRNDIHSDHRIVFEGLSPSFKSFRYPSIKRILMMETLSETDQSVFFSPMMFRPNFYVDISDTLERKIEIFQMYESEVGVAPFPRSPEIVKAAAQCRGSAIMATYAEAFEIIKEVW